ncbi:hypothetical protein BKA61DRAFT_594607 [Leptodontidium sp. MPI-SDFR-AT-0119]|nr:hypothetical protein BKA61DRAFT_594607 [Leptodontidium sp. MPI-SDFR-AT-0119]
MSLLRRICFLSRVESSSSALLFSVLCGGQNFSKRQRSESTLPENFYFCSSSPISLSNLISKLVLQPQVFPLRPAKYPLRDHELMIRHMNGSVLNSPNSQSCTYSDSFISVTQQEG